MMISFGGITITKVLLFLFLIMSQILAVSLIPKTMGFSNFYWTSACLMVYFFATWALAYTIYLGMPLGLIIPILSAVVPLAAIAVGVFFFKESASNLKVAILCTACVLVGIASSTK